MILFTVKSTTSKPVSINADSGKPADSGAIYYPQLGDELFKEKPINGIDPKAYGRFWKNWKLITVRYRSDIHELRFIYANSFALKSLSKGRADFQPGSVLAKLAYAVKEDPLFPVSNAPARSVRVQYMLKHPSTENEWKPYGEWSFAIYPRDLTEIRSEKLEEITCFACHQIARDRDFVFSFADVLLPQGDRLGDKRFCDYFKRQRISTLAPKIRKFIQNSARFHGEFAKEYKMALFSGSLMESLRPMALYVEKERIPYVLYDDTPGNYLAVVPLPENSQCHDEVAAEAIDFSQGNEPGSPISPAFLRRFKLCGDEMLSSSFETIKATRK